MQIIDILAPVFLIIALGFILKRTNFISTEFVKGLETLVYWLGLPCLMFREIVTANYNGPAAAKTLLVTLLGMAASIIAAYLAAGALKIPYASVGTFVQGAFRGNLMYIGLPILIYSFTKMPAQNDLVNTAVLALAFLVPFYNVAAVVVLLASQHKIDRLIFGKVLTQVIINPVVIAAAAAFLYKAVFHLLPLSLDRTASAIGQIALPAALLAIGAAFAEGEIENQRAPAFICSVIKCFLTPIIGLLFVFLLGLNRFEARIALIYLACPTAVVTYVMADQLEGDPKLAAATVLVSTVLSIFSLAAVLAFFQP